MSARRAALQLRKVLFPVLVLGTCVRAVLAQRVLSTGEGGALAAHAWVEYQGNAIGEPEASHLHYAAFVEEMSGGLS